MTSDEALLCTYGKKYSTKNRVEQLSFCFLFRKIHSPLCPEFQFPRYVLVDSVARSYYWRIFLEPAPGQMLHKAKIILRKNIFSSLFYLRNSSNNCMQYHSCLGK